MKKQLAGLLAVALLALAALVIACQSEQPAPTPPPPVAAASVPVAPPVAPPPAAVVIPAPLMQEAEKEITAGNATAAADQLEKELDQELAEE